VSSVCWRLHTPPARFHSPGGRSCRAARQGQRSGALWKPVECVTARNRRTVKSHNHTHLHKYTGTEQEDARKEGLLGSVSWLLGWRSIVLFAAVAGSTRRHVAREQDTTRRLMKHCQCA